MGRAVALLEATGSTAVTATASTVLLADLRVADAGRMGRRSLLDVPALPFHAETVRAGSKAGARPTGLAYEVSVVQGAEGSRDAAASAVRAATKGRRSVETVHRPYPLPCATFPGTDAVVTTSTAGATGATVLVVATTRAS